MTSRRNFLKTSLIAASAVTVSPIIRAQAAMDQADDEIKSFPESRKISVLSYSFHGLRRRGMMDVFHFMESCKYRYHLNAADLWSGHLDSTDEDFIKKVREALDERELFIPNIAVDGAHVLGDSPEETEALHQTAWAYLRAANTLRVGFVRIDSGPRTSANEWTEEQFDFVVGRYREYAQFAHDHGFKMGSENHTGPSLYWPSMKKLILAVDHPGFGICNHISGWSGTKEEKDRADIESAPYTLHTHIPWDICEGPLEEKMNILRAANYPGYYSVEHHSARNEYANVATQLARVRTVMQNWALEGDGTSN